MANESGILVIGETVDGRAAPITFELLGAARRLANELSQTVACVFLGNNLSDSLGREAIAQGADKVYLVDDPLLAEYRTDPYLAAAERVCREANPATILLGQTMIGRDMAPRLACRLGSAAAMDCISLTLRDGKLVMTRPCYGGSAHADYTARAMPQIATVRAKSQEPLEADASRQGEVVRVTPGLDASVARTKVIGRTRVKAEGIRLEDAPIVVSGGRGLGGPEGFQVLEELAQVLGGAVGASRAVCDLGWYPVSAQIGLTGKVVTPSLYIAVGISGASQHMAGVSQVKNIVAINKDAEANIFKSSRFGVVADWKPVVGALIKECQKLRS